MSYFDPLNTVLSWVLLGLLLWNGYILLFNRGVPNIRTAPAIRKKMIELLKAQAIACANRPFTIIDLGSGNGLLTRQIARAMPEAKVIGIEISGKSHAWAQTLGRLCNLKNLEYKKTDLFSDDLSQADAVVFYLTVYEMGRIGEKLRAELKPGTMVISNRFQMGGEWKPAQSIDVRTFYPHQKTLHVYVQAAGAL